MKDAFGPVECLHRWKTQQGHVYLTKNKGGTIAGRIVSSSSQELVISPKRILGLPKGADCIPSGELVAYLVETGVMLTPNTKGTYDVTIIKKTTYK